MYNRNGSEYFLLSKSSYMIFHKKNYYMSFPHVKIELIEAKKEINRSLY